MNRRDHSQITVNHVPTGCGATECRTCGGDDHHDRMPASQFPGGIEGARLALWSACIFLTPVAAAIAGATLFPGGGIGGVCGFAAGAAAAKAVVAIIQRRGATGKLKE